MQDHLNPDNYQEENLKLAIHVGINTYNSTDSPCLEHSRNGITRRFVETNECVICAIGHDKQVCRNGNHVANYSRQGKPHTCSTCATSRQQEIDQLLIYLPKGKCRHCGKRYIRSTETNMCLNPDCDNGGVGTRSYAKATGVPYYQGGKACPDCGSYWKVTRNDRCASCKCPPHPQRDENWHYKIKPVGRNESPRQIALANGESWYTPNDPCPHCNKTAPRHVNNGRCQGCHPPRSEKGSPRQQAIAKGQTWYTPDKLCPGCLTMAPRRVNDGKCSQCAGLTIINDRGVRR